MREVLNLGIGQQPSSSGVFLPGTNSNKERQVMRKQFIRAMVFCAACLVLGAQGQNSTTDPSAPGSSTPGSPDSSISSPNSSQYSSQRYSATGRTGQQGVRASKLMGAQVKSSSGESLGTINDVILNPSSGRIDFAVISLSSSSSSTPTPGTSASDTASQSSLSASSGGKLLAVPWTLLRSSGAMAYGAASAGSKTSASGSFSAEQQTFVFTGDKSKLQSAPSFDQSNWPDMNGSEWRHSIHSYYGVQQGSSTGAASSPGGVDSSSGSSSTSPSSPDSSSTQDSPDSSSSGKPQ